MSATTTTAAQVRDSNNHDEPEGNPATEPPTPAVDEKGVDPPKTPEDKEKPNDEPTKTVNTSKFPALCIVPFGSLGGIVTTAVPNEEKELTWKIKNFPELISLSSPSVKDDIQFGFKMGREIGMECTWTVRLTKKGDKLGFFLELLDVPYGWGTKEVNAKFTIRLMLAGERDTYRFIRSEIRDFSGPISFGFTDFAKISDILLKDNGILVDKDDTAIFVLNVTVYNRYTGFKIEVKARDAVGGGGHDDEDRIGGKVALEEFGVLLESGIYSDVTLEAGDGSKFKAHKAILSARSPVFAAMFESKMSEAMTSHVNLNDMSGPALKILLRFIYTAEIDAGKAGSPWYDVCGEIINAADKYALPILKDKCDLNLIKTCTPSNALTLLRLTRLHGMKKAEAKLVDWIKENIDEVLKNNERN